MYKFWRDYKFSTTIWEFCKSRGFPYFVVTAEDPCTEHVPSCCLLLNLGKNIHIYSDPGGGGSQTCYFLNLENNQISHDTINIDHPEA